MGGQRGRLTRARRLANGCSTEQLASDRRSAATTTTLAIAQEFTAGNRDRANETNVARRNRESPQGRAKRQEGSRTGHEPLERLAKSGGPSLGADWATGVTRRQCGSLAGSPLRSAAPSRGERVACCAHVTLQVSAETPNEATLTFKSAEPATRNGRGSFLGSNPLCGRELGRTTPTTPPRRRARPRRIAIFRRWTFLHRCQRRQRIPAPPIQDPQ